MYKVWLWLKESEDPVFCKDTDTLEDAKTYCMQDHSGLIMGDFFAVRVDEENVFTYIL